MVALPQQHRPNPKLSIQTMLLVMYGLNAVKHERGGCAQNIDIRHRKRCWVVMGNYREDNIVTLIADKK